MRGPCAGAALRWASSGVQVAQDRLERALEGAHVRSSGGYFQEGRECFWASNRSNGSVVSSLKEAAKLGFKRVLMPKRNLKGLQPPQEIKATGVKRLHQVLDLVL